MYCPGLALRVTSVYEACTPGPPEGTRVTRILVVDDNPSVRRYLRGVLEQQEGWQVCDEARNGQEAVDRFSLLRPDVVVARFPDARDERSRRRSYHHATLAGNAHPDGDPVPLQAAF